MSTFWTMNGVVFLLLVTVLIKDKVVARSIKGNSCVQSTKLATFNAALLPGFFSPIGNPEIEARTARLIQEIRESDVDIFCLQEVFFTDIQRQVYNGVRDIYPYVHTVADLTADGSDPTPACSVGETELIVTCSLSQCSGLDGLDSLVCGASCLTESNVSLICLSCFGLFGGETGPTICPTFPAANLETNYGLMLLSRKKLENRAASGFNNQSQFRGYLEASVDGVGDLICTHLTSLSPVYVGPPLVSPFLYSNYDEQQYDELLTLFEVATSKETPILIGDFNNGPANPGNGWEFPFNYGLINARGFVSPFVLEDGRCTFCLDNPSGALSGIPLDLVIDHVYVTTDSFRGRVISSKRILDDVILDSGNPLSDHYGVELTLKDIRLECGWLLDRRRFYCPQPSRPQLLALPPPQAELERLCVATED